MNLRARGCIVNIGETKPVYQVDHTLPLSSELKSDCLELSEMPYKLMCHGTMAHNCRGGSRICGKGGGGGAAAVPFEDPLWNFKGGGAPPAPPLNPLVISQYNTPPKIMHGISMKYIIEQ